MIEHRTVLYRKYRPESFDQVFGQEHIVKVLKGSLELGNIGHAYLFSGPRGTGKTTMARILAKELECSETDIIEIDAASNRGIDDIRQLREGVHSLPFSSPYKMYIIDEVHMLTKEAFNALLKTLEEPPAHVIFVLATTELHKVLPTVVSRCQSFVFKSPTQTVLKEMIQGIVDKEGFSIDAGSLELIALLGNGSFRDTQGVLQKLVSYSNDKKITRDEVELVTGAPSQQLIENLLTAINEKNAESVIDFLKQAQEQNIDAYIFVQMLVQAVRTILFIRFSKEEQARIKEQLDEETYKFYLNLAKEKNNIHSGLLATLLDSYKNMHVSFSQYLALELALIELLES
jgi:DNA polymerase-3 subunit gamma/tau